MAVPLNSTQIHLSIQQSNRVRSTRGILVVVHSYAIRIRMPYNNPDIAAVESDLRIDWTAEITFFSSSLYLSLYLVSSTTCFEQRVSWCYIAYIFHMKDGQLNCSAGVWGFSHSGCGCVQVLGMCEMTPPV